MPWFWDRNVRVALAPGITCFEAGKEYEHGGLSPQEVVVPEIVVTRGSLETRNLIIQAPTWRGCAAMSQSKALKDTPLISG
ncbi:MAG: hypothetical protein RQM90_01190 [Methanoculleus sp.]